jgi:mannosyltransferase
LLAPPIATLALVLLGIGSASFWRDEAATLTATRRPFPELLRMLGHVDAAHGAYYILLWPVTHLAGTSEFVMRLPSAIAMAAAAFGIAVIGRRLMSWQVGTLAGLVFAVLPLTSRFGEEARSYALVTAFAVATSYLLIRAIETPERRAWRAYGISLTALGLLNLFSLLIIPAHAVTLAAARRRGGQRGQDGTVRTARSGRHGQHRGRRGPGTRMGGRCRRGLRGGGADSGVHLAPAPAARVARSTAMG